MTPPGRLPPTLLGRLLLRLRPLGSRRAEVAADLDEQFHFRARQRGRWYAAARYCADAFSLWTHRPIRTIVAAAHHEKGLAALLTDMRFALRMFRCQPAAVSMAVIGLALAIGLTTAVFGWVNAGNLRQIGVPDARSVVDLVSVYDNGRESGVRPYDEFLQLREASDLVQLEAWWRERAALGDTGIETVRVMPVSRGFFQTLRVGASAGRVLTAGDDAPSSPLTTVVNHAFWTQRMGGDSSIVGQTVRLGGHSFTVVGVVEAGFNGPEPQVPPAFWIPFSAHSRVWRQSGDRNQWAWIVGRVNPGSTRGQAEAELSAIAVGLAAESGNGSPQVARVRLPVAGKSLFDSPSTWWYLGTIASILGLVLLLACANVANVLLAVALARRREISVRLALGASRWRIVRQLLTESLMLSVAGGAGGWLCAVWSLPLLATLFGTSATIDVSPDLRVHAFLVLVTSIVGLGAGLAPAGYGARGDLAAPLSGGPREHAATRRPGRARSVLVGLQALASINLLILAALFGRSLVQATRLDPGFDQDRLVTVSPSFTTTGYDAPTAAAYLERAVDRITAVPGVDRAAVVLHAPFGGRHRRRAQVRRHGRAHTVYLNQTTPDYFAVMGIPLVEGRTYGVVEVETGARVAVVTESVARALWPNESPIGRTLEQVADDLASTHVIGVVADATAVRLDLNAGHLFQPLSTADARYAQIVVRSTPDPTEVLQPVLDATRALDPQVSSTAMTVRAAAERELQVPRAFAALAGLLGLVALGLAVTGVFGSTATAVEQRRGEIGIRLAVGATTADVIRLMLRDSFRPVGAGIILGLLLALATGRVLTAVLHGVGPQDPLAIGVAIAVLSCAAALASTGPARRASRVDPVQTLHRG